MDTTRFFSDDEFSEASLGISSIRRRFAILGFPHRRSLKFDAVSVVNEPVYDAIGEGGIADLIVPVREGHLAGQDGRANRIAVITDFQKVPAFAVGQWSHGPIIDNQDVDACKTIQQFAEAAVGASNSQIPEKTRRPRVR
jgi:hypothetical protein